MRDYAVVPLTRSNVSEDPAVIEALYQYKPNPKRPKDTAPVCLNLRGNTRVCTVRYAGRGGRRHSRVTRAEWRSQCVYLCPAWQVSTGSRAFLCGRPASRSSGPWYHLTTYLAQSTMHLQMH
jgi:hypothetical protein